MDLKFKHIISLVCLATFPVIAFSESLQIPKGFSFKLIPWDSTESPHHLGNLTQEERLQQLVMISNARAAAWGLSGYLRPDVRLVTPNYVIEVGFGSKPEYMYLEMDTGSDLIWVQSVDCLRCFHVKGGSFRSNESDSFRYISCHSRSCPSKKCRFGTRCYHEIQYEDRSFAHCHLSSDYFIFPSDDPKHLYKVGPVIFGIGYYNIGLFEEEDNTIAGILGLGHGSLSFVGQLLRYDIASFSYCLPSVEGKYSTIKFGEDAKSLPPRALIQKTHFVPGPIAAAYFLNCTGISVAGVDIGLPTDTFKYQPLGNGGLTIDTGTPITYLHPDAFDRILHAMDKYFASYGIKSSNYTGTDYWFRCYSRPWLFRNFPNVTFHLQGADLSLDHRNIFFINRYNMCMLFRSNSYKTKTSILGARAQANKRFLYDLEENQLSFYPEDCS